MKDRILSIIVPAYNEDQTIRLILDRIIDVKLNGNFRKEIIVVNDFSEDDTVRIVNDYIDNHPEHNIKIYSQPKNMGKGAAMKTGCDFAVHQGAEIGWLEVFQPVQSGRSMLLPALSNCRIA